MRKACLLSDRFWRSAILVLTTAMLLHAGPNPTVLPAYGKLPLAFEENRGQASAGVTYLARTRGGVVLLRPGSVALEVDRGQSIIMRFAGVARASAPTGEHKLPGITSYLVGNESDWVRGVPNYASVRYASVYAGIDAVFHGDQQQRLEYDLVLKPGADPEQIRIAFEGVDRIAVDTEGNLELSTAHGTVKHRTPKIWQSDARGQREVAGRYVLSGAAEARFEIDSYDRRSTLVIDPVIEYSTYFGSNRDDRAAAVATDATGAAYIAGITATAAVSSGFVSKINPAGTAVVYTVYLGSGECDAGARGLAVDSANNAVVTGYYTQKDAAGACNVKQVLGAKINPTGDAFVYELVWGGGHDYGNAVAVDGAGNAYFTGSTRGSFPTTPGVIMTVGGFVGDAFITKLDPTGAVVYSTYLGEGSSDEGLAIAVDTSGNAYIGGSTASSKFRTTANAVQNEMMNTTRTGFVTEVNSTATQILYSSFLGGDNSEAVYGIAVDGQGKIHVTGTTASTDFPTTANAWDRTCGTDGACNPYNDGAWHNTEDVFYSKIDPLRAGAAGLMYSTFLGGANRDFGEGIALDANGRAWIVGCTGSGDDFPKVQPTQGTIGGNYDAFIANIDPAQSGATSLLFSSYLGGALFDEGIGIDVDRLGNVYVTGFTGSTNFPVVDALQPQTAGGNDGFLVKFTSTPAAALSSVALNPASLTGGAVSSGTVKLTAAAPAGGAVVTLTSNNINAATVPASVTVAANATTATFAVTSKAVTAATVVPITASYNGVSKASTLVVNSLLASIVLNPSVVISGAGSTGTVTLSAAAPAGGAVVTLTSSNLNAATVPASVTVAANATSATFAVTTKPVATDTGVNITATFGGASRVITLTVMATLTSLSASPVSVTGGAASTGTVTLGSAAPAGGAVVTLVSSNTNAVSVPASVTVAANAAKATFAITTKAVSTPTSVTITAKYNGASKAVTVIVEPPLTAVTLNPVSVTGGAGSTGTVTLGVSAPAGGAIVTLTSNNLNAATVPASVTVAANATTATFVVSSKAVTTATPVTVTASYGGAAKAATLTVNPPAAALASVALNPTPVTGAAGSTGTVTLGAAAPAGGAVVALMSNNINAASVPASVTVAANATTANFAITTKPVTTATAVVITATYAGVSKASGLVVNSPLASIVLNPSVILGGAGSAGTVTLSAVAPVGGAVVTLASSNLNAATVPASVTVAANATSATFAVMTKPMTTDTGVNITATFGGASKVITLSVMAPLNSLSVNPVSVTGGAASTGTVTLGALAPAGGAVVTLLSSNANAAAVPASVTVAANATKATFAITTKAVAAATAVTITASYGGVTNAATFTVNPGAALAAVALNPVAVTGGAGSTGTVTLGAAAPVGGAIVTLTSNNLNGATVPASVTVAANATTATFAVTSKTVTTATAVTITATYSGVAKTASLTVNPAAAALAAVTLNPVAVTGGVGSTGTVTLNAAAPAGGAVVTLTSNNLNAATVPASVTVAANATTATFAVTSKAVIAATAVAITASYSGVPKAATLTVNPPAAALAAVTLNPAAVTGGAGSTGTVTLTAAAPAGGAVVTLVSNNLNAATVPASVMVAANATTATFGVTSKAVTTATAVTITASYSGVAKAATLTVNPAATAALASVSFNPATMIFGSVSTGTVMLTAPAPAGGAVIALSSSDWVSFYLPASVTVVAGATTAHFNVSTAIGKSTTTITATYNGVNKTAVLTSVYPTVVALACNPNPVIAGNTTVCTVTLNGIMPAPTPVWVLSDQPFFVPANGTATVPAGASSTAFSLATTLVPDKIVANISANALATSTVTTPLTINLTNRGRKWVLNNVALKGGGTANGYFIYEAATGQYLAANIQTTPGPDPLNPLGHAPQNLYYYPWPNGFTQTFVNAKSTASVLALQYPISPDEPSWTLLQLNFAQPLTQAGGTVALVTNPNVAYTPFCVDNLPGICTPPPANISQELFALPPGWAVNSGFHFRVIVSGSVTAQ